MSCFPWPRSKGRGSSEDVQMLPCKVCGVAMAHCPQCRSNRLIEKIIKTGIDRKVWKYDHEIQWIQKKLSNSGIPAAYLELKLQKIGGTKKPLIHPNLFIKDLLEYRYVRPRPGPVDDVIEFENKLNGDLHHHPKVASRMIDLRIRLPGPSKRTAWTAHYSS